MTGSAVSRFVWKEYRVMRGFWISLVLMALLGQLTVVAYPPQTVFVPMLFAVALMGTSLYALGSGATMFATEREEETYELLRAPPVAARQVVVGKLAFAVMSIVAFGLLLWASAWTLGGRRLPDPHALRNCGRRLAWERWSSCCGACYFRSCRVGR